MQENIDNKQSPENFKNKVALITGITGQDGSYLAEFLLKKNYMAPIYLSYQKNSARQISIK